MPDGIFTASTPVIDAPEQDTAIETAELENHEEETTEEVVQQETEELTNEQEETDSNADHSDELLAGKYKTQEDLVKAYKNLEKQFHETRQKPAQQPPVQPQDGFQEDPNDVVLRMINEDPIGTIQYFVNQAINPLQEERTNEKLAQSISGMAKDYSGLRTEEGMKAYFDKIEEIAQEFGNPNLIRNPSPRVLKMAAEDLWPKSTAQVYQQAKQAGRQEAEQARKAKAGLNAPTNTKHRETPKSQEELAADAIVSAGSKKGMFG